MKRSQPLRRVSRKTAARDRRYARERRVFLDANPRCGVCAAAWATEVHHMAGRAASVFFDQSKWLPVCHPCHEHVTRNPEHAIAEGWSLRRNEVTG